MLSQISKKNLISKIHDTSQVSGLTHGFYNYPARFSPQFSRSIIQEFTNVGDIVLDPFMGGGTTIIEAISLGRQAIGVDINELAYFVTKVKSTVYTKEELDCFRLKANHIIDSVNINQQIVGIDLWLVYGTLKNLDSNNIWRLTRLISLYKDRSKVFNNKIGDLFRCTILKVAQWAIDNKKEIVALDSFRSKLRETIDDFVSGAIDYHDSLKKNSNISNKPILIRGSAININRYKRIKDLGAPKLIVTSPPYPGVHILYHRWQVKGRKETAAPYWITNIEDGHGEGYYTFGYRNQKDLKDYFDFQYKSFRTLSKILNPETIVVQLVAFSNPTWQLSKYLDVMHMAGFCEINPLSHRKSNRDRIWRDVPHRKWYAQKNGATASSKEVVLFHSIR